MTLKLKYGSVQGQPWSFYGVSIVSIPAADSYMFLRGSNLFLVIVAKILLEDRQI